MPVIGTVCVYTVFLGFGLQIGWDQVSFSCVAGFIVCDQVSTSLGNSGLCWTVFARNKDAVPAEGNGDLQTLLCVLVARPRRCLTLSNPVPWQNWMVAYLGYILQMRTLFRGWPIMVNDTHTRRRSLRKWELNVLYNILIGAVRCTALITILL